MSCIDDLATPSPDPVIDTTAYLSKPYGIQSKAKQNGHILLHWFDSTTYSVSYIIQRADSTSSFIAIDTLEIAESLSADTFDYVDSTTKIPHAGYTYRIFSLYKTFISEASESISTVLPNNEPELLLNNYNVVVNRVYMVGDTIKFCFAYTDLDNDTITISNPDSLVTILGDTGIWNLTNTNADTLLFIGSDNYGGNDSLFVPIIFIDSNHAPEFREVYLPPLGKIGQRVSGTYSLSDSNNDEITIFIDSIYSPDEDLRKVIMYPEDTLFSFNVLTLDKGPSILNFIAQDIHGATDTVRDSIFAFENIPLIFNTSYCDTFTTLARFDVDGLNGERLLPDNDSLGDPILSQDYGKIIYTVDETNFREIRLIDVDGAGDQLLFLDSQKVYTPVSWVKDYNSVVLQMAVGGNSSLSFVIYNLNTQVFDTVYSGIINQGEAWGPVNGQSADDYFYSVNDSLFYLSSSQVKNLIAANAYYPHVHYASATLFYISQESVSQGVEYTLIQSDITGQNSTAVAVLGGYTTIFCGLHQQSQMLYGMACKQDVFFVWRYFIQYQRFITSTLKFDEDN